MQKQIKPKKVLSEEHKRKIAEALKGRLLTPMTPEIIEKIRLAKTGVPNAKTSIGLKKVYAEGKYTPSMKGKTWESIYGKEKADIMKKNMGKQNIGKIPWIKGKTKETESKLMEISIKNTGIGNAMFGKHLSDETKRKIGEIKKFQSKGVLNGMYGKKRSVESVRRQMETTKMRPTPYENKISELCIEHHLPFIYTGDGTFLIGYKNPDFVNKEKRIAIEVYEDFYKIMGYGSCENYEKQRREYFAKYGWSVIFIDSSDIKSSDWKSKCLNKIGGFN